MNASATTLRVDPFIGDLLEPLVEQLPGLAVIDAHTHLGVDVDGTGCDRGQLLQRLDVVGADARACTFPLHVGNGDYRSANDAVIATAAASEGRLVPFCRLNPERDPIAEGRRAIAAGARGIKLHPRAESFTLAHPEVERIVALADEHALPVLIHAGRGIEPLGEDALRLAAAHPRATLILAHAGITDLAWLPGVVEEYPNVLFDTAWWNPADLLALFRTVPAGQIVFGSDIPFGDPALNAVLTLRCARQAGLADEQVEAIMGAQLERVLAGDPLLDLGPPPRETAISSDVTLERATTYLAAVWGSVMAGGSGEEPMALARMALRVGDSHPHREACRAALEALGTSGPELMGLGGLAIAATILATPGVAIRR